MLLIWSDFFAIVGFKCQWYEWDIEHFTHDDIFLGNIDHNAIGLSLTAYVEFSENDLIDNEFTGCTYGDSAYAWTYLHFHEPISRMT